MLLLVPPIILTPSLYRQLLRCPPSLFLRCFQRPQKHLRASDLIWAILPTWDVLSPGIYMAHYITSPSSPTGRHIYKSRLKECAQEHSQILVPLNNAHLSASTCCHLLEETGQAASLTQNLGAWTPRLKCQEHCLLSELEQLGLAGAWPHHRWTRERGGTHCPVFLRGEEWTHTRSWHIEPRDTATRFVFLTAFS